jgi:LysR family transcriptional regulator, carnitine catabolism transcriptional activator
MDVRRLSLFLAVVDHGSFTKAAAASYLSQPGLSSAVAELETELGVRLFDRLGHGVALTAAGRALVGPARQVLRDVATAAAAVAEVSGLQSGTVAVGCLPTLAADPMAGIIGAFRRQRPGVQVHLAAPEDPIDLLAMVRSGTVEVAVTESAGPAPGLVAHPVAVQELVAILPPGSPLAAPRLTLRRLADHPLVVTPPGTSSRRVLDDALARAGLALSAAVESAQREALLPLVLAGAGAALVPSAVAATAALQGAVVAPLRPPLTRPIALVHRNAPLSPAADAFRSLAGVPVEDR